ncbi:MAG: quinolinate synthase NadA [Anaerolineae bacterium]|nr:quinolinate synthase NadA [Anaerolineae bacterium]
MKEDWLQKRAIAQVEEAKRKLGDELLILAHHYQRDEVVRWADFRGDSLELSRRAAATHARYIVFCGVRFMAETAAILAQPAQQVFTPRPDAGCFLADQARIEQVQSAWKALTRGIDASRGLVPITYVNSDAEIKAFVGQHGGAMCTSANAGKVLAWALRKYPRVLFLPDQHLGHNAAYQEGIVDKEILFWDPRFPPSDIGPFHRARLILWRGACNVHVRFLPTDVQHVREKYPEVKVIVHPECREDVVSLADEMGSTSYIIRAIRESPPGSVWAVGTEEHLVARLRAENPEKKILSLKDPPPYCIGMSLTRATDLAHVLTSLVKGRETGVVKVPEKVAAPAHVALNRMLEITG